MGSGDAPCMGGLSSSSGSKETIGNQIGATDALRNICLPDMGSAGAARIVVGCVSENNEKFLSRSLRLLQSIRWFGGQLANVDVIICLVDGTEASYKSKFVELGAIVRDVPRFNRTNPFANKMQFLSLPDLEQYETAILLDCDTVLVADPSPFLVAGKLQAKIADVPSIPTKVLASVCRQFGLATPEPSYKTTFGQTSTIWYCNSGVLVVPLQPASNLISAWSDYETRLAQQPELLGSYNIHRGQAALALAFLSNPIPFDELQVSMNFPLHLTHMDTPDSLLEADPVILHYHHCVDEAGYLAPSPYPCAQKHIRRFNNRLRESRQVITGNGKPQYYLGSSIPNDLQALWGTKQLGLPEAVAHGRQHDTDPAGSGESIQPSRRPAIEPEAKVVCVLGMHRCGTSLITWLLNLLGVYLGEPDQMMPAQSDNPKGYWEHLAITSLNEEILDRLGGSWHEPPGLGPGWEQTALLSNLRNRAAGLIQDTFGNSACWGWKDPRNSLVLPFWRSLLPRMQYVVCIRNPVDTAFSLQRRRGFSFEKCADLWLSYVAAALENTANESRLIVFYEDFVDDWQSGLRLLARFIGAPERADLPEVQMNARQFFEQELCHHRTAIPDVMAEHGLSFSARALYLSLRSYGLAGLGRQDSSKLSDEFTRAAMESLRRSSVIAQSDLRVLRLKESRLQQDLARSRTLGEALASELEDRQTELDKITGSLAWRLMSRYGRVKHKILLPILRRLKSKK